LQNSKELIGAHFASLALTQQTLNLLSRSSCWCRFPIAPCYMNQYGLMLFINLLFFMNKLYRQEIKT